MIILDMETDGLYYECTKIHCAVAYDTISDNYTIFRPETIHELPLFLDGVKQLSCHNGIGFDLKVIKKVLNYEYKGKYFDTLLLSRILWPDLEPATWRDPETGKTGTSKSIHGVEGWGIRFGIAKPVHEDWTVFNEAMLHRCTEDVNIQTKLYHHIRQQMQTFAVRELRTAHSWVQIIEMEQKVWRMMEDVEEYGWAFDMELAFNLKDELTGIIEDIEHKLTSILPQKLLSNGKITKAFKADGSLTEVTKRWLLTYPTWQTLKDDSCVNNVCCGDYCKIQYKEFNLNSPKDVKDYLLSWGWKPKEWNFKKDRFNKPIRDDKRNLIKTTPKVPKTAEDWQEVAELMGKPDVALLAERNKATHRLHQIEGLINNVRSDHRIAAQATTCSTNTARMVHRVVVNIPKAIPEIYYGQKMRSLFVASPGKVLVGVDASALEARCEAHYVCPYDEQASTILISGDIHSHNAQLFGVSRQLAKNGKYAILYGCSPAKLAQTLNKPLKHATGIYDTYWQGNPALKQLKEDLEDEFKDKGYILAIDGRPLTIRYKHAIINTLFQSCGAISVKVAMCIFDRARKKLKYDVHILGVFHDEMQIECTPDIADEVGQLAVDSFRQSGRYLKLNVPLDAEYKIGINWATTH